MSPRSLLLPFLLSVGLAAPAAADKLLVADPNGLVHMADTATGTFQTFAGPCIGALRMLAADDQRLFGLDEFDQLYVFDLASGDWLGLLAPGVGTINSLTAGTEGLFVGTNDGNVVRLDPETGQVLGKRATPDGVRTLLLEGDKLFVGSANGAIYRAEAAEGEFTYFSCFCFFNINRMVMDAGELVVADESGTVVRIDIEDGTLLTGFWLGGQQVAGASRGALLLYYEDGVIPRVDARTGEPLPGSFQSPGEVSALLVLREPGQKATRRLGQRP
jgi:outer membrane protein assembly factor BamB